jgi:hypothetical protein
MWALAKSPSLAAVVSGFGGLRPAVTILNPSDSAVASSRKAWAADFTSGVLKEA